MSGLKLREGSYFNLLIYLVFVFEFLLRECRFISVLCYVCDLFCTTVVMYRLYSKNDRKHAMGTSFHMQYFALNGKLFNPVRIDSNI